MSERLPKGHLRKRGTTWWCQWKHGGVPYAKSLGTKSETEARGRFKDLMERVRTAIRDGDFDVKFRRPDDAPACVIDGDVKLSKLWNGYVSLTNRRDSGETTLEQYRHQVGQFVEWARRRGLGTVSAVGKSTAREYAVNLRSRKLSPNTYNKHLNALRMVFSAVGDQIGLDTNPWVGDGANSGRTRTPETSPEAVKLSPFCHLSGTYDMRRQDGACDDIGACRGRAGQTGIRCKSLGAKMK